MSSAVRMGVKRVAMAAVRPAVQVAPRRALSSERSQTLLQNQAKFQQNPHLHREMPSREEKPEMYDITKFSPAWASLSSYG